MQRQSFTQEQMFRLANEYFSSDPTIVVDVIPSKRGSVAIAKSKLGSLVIKFADLSNLETETRIVPPRSVGIRNEAKILGSLPSGKAPGLYSFFEDMSSVYSLIEYIEGQPLSQSLQNRRKLIAPFIGAVADICGLGLIHGDISPDNALLLNDGNVKLIDFELAHESSDDPIAPGLHHYLSPAAAAAYINGDTLVLDTREETFAVAASSLSILSGRTPHKYSRPGIRRLEAITEIALTPTYDTEGVLEADFSLASKLKNLLEAPVQQRPGTPMELLDLLSNEL